MAKAKKVAPNTKEMDTQEFFEALMLIGQEKGISQEELVKRIQAAITTAVKKDPAGSENCIVEIDPEAKRFYVALRKEVAEEVEDPTVQITIEEAVKYNKAARIGETVEIPLEPKKFSRIAAQSAKHVIRQGIREAEKGILMEEYRSSSPPPSSAGIPFGKALSWRSAIPRPFCPRASSCREKSWRTGRRSGSMWWRPRTGRRVPE